MGKIRIKAFDENSAEDEAKLKVKREAKKAEKMAAKNELKQAQGKKPNPQTDGTMSKITTNDVKTSLITEKATEKEQTTTPVIASDSKAILKEKPTKKSKKEKFVKTKLESKRHKENMSAVSKTQTYNVDQAIETLKKFRKSKFDETVELHLNTKEKGISGQVVLPHGTGKKLVIKVADDTIIAEVTKGKINFDILVATPSMMPSLAKVAKVLGPRGLMPNPKNGTITDNTTEAVKKLSGGQISYKTESTAPIIHAIVGKISFEDAKLKDNINTFITAVGLDKIKSVTLKSTMSPAIHLNSASLRSKSAVQI